jgi:hypothetical protein
VDSQSVSTVLTDSTVEAKFEAVEVWSLYCAAPDAGDHVKLWSSSTKFPPSAGERSDTWLPARVNVRSPVLSSLVHGPGLLSASRRRIRHPYTPDASEVVGVQPVIAVVTVSTRFELASGRSTFR